MSKLQVSKKNKSANAVSVGVSVILGLVATLCAYVVIVAMTQGYVSLFGFSLFRVVTGSMEPQIPVGALLICKEVEIGSLELGDIVCFFSQEAGRLDQIITHRIVDITRGLDGMLQLQTKGDANLVSDVHYVTAQNLIGQVVYHTGSGGKGHMAANLMSFLTSGVGFITCLALPCMMIVGMLLQESVKSMRADLEVAMRLLNNEAEIVHEYKPPVQKPEPAAIFSEEEIAIMKAQIRRELMEELGMVPKKTQPEYGLSEEELEEMSRSIRAELREELSRIANKTQ